MELNLWLLLLLVLAIGIGWLLGRRGGVTIGQASDTNAMPSQYYKGLNYLLNDHPDSALDSFIEALEVNSETLETHIAVGNLMRRKGEVDRAIRIHQNLLSRPSLPREHLHQAHLELARDFIAAGLLDRAERLLEELLNEAPELRSVAMRHLLEVFQDEREWQQAIDTAKQIQPKKSLLKPNSTDDPVIAVALSHYSCEQACESLKRNDYLAARTQLKQALNYDKDCVRASLMLGELELDTGHLQQSVKALKKIRFQDPLFIPESVELLKRCYQQLADRDGFHQYLRECLLEQPSVSVVLSLAEDIQQCEGDDAAARFVGEELKKRPSLRGLEKLVELLLSTSSGASRENLSVLQLLISQLMASKPQYRCQSCGFSGRQLHWLCPGCKQWGQIKSIRGAEGD